MYLTPPQTVSGSLITLKNPGTVQNSTPPVSIQIQNASGWILTVQGSGAQVTIQPFTAATIPIATGQDVATNPTFDAYPNLANGYVSAEWLINKELPSQPDGPLTSAATIAAQPFTGFQQLYNSPQSARGAGFSSPLTVVPNGVTQLLVSLAFLSACDNDTWEIHWFLDAAGTISLGTQTWIKKLNAPTTVAVPVAGVSFRFRYVVSGANNTNVGVTVYGYGDQVINPFLAIGNVVGTPMVNLLNIQNQPCPNGVATAFNPGYIVNGEVDMFSIMSVYNSNTALGIDVWDGSGQWVIHMRPSQISPTNAQTATRFTLPFSDWRVSVANFSGASINAYCTLVARGIR